EATSADNRGPQPLPGQKPPPRDGNDLAADHDERERRDDRPLLDEDPRVDQLARRHEEHGDEEILQRLYEVLDLLAVAGFRDQRSGDERAKRDRITERRGEERGGEANAYAPQERHLVAIRLDHAADRPRHDQQPDHDEPDQENDEPHDG